MSHGLCLSVSLSLTLCLCLAICPFRGFYLRLIFIFFSSYLLLERLRDTRSYTHKFKNIDSHTLKLRYKCSQKHKHAQTSKHMRQRKRTNCFLIPPPLPGEGPSATLFEGKAISRAWLHFLFFRLSFGHFSQLVESPPEQSPSESMHPCQDQHLLSLTINAPSEKVHSINF